MFTRPYQWMADRGLQMQRLDPQTGQVRELTPEEKSESFYYDPIELE